MTPMTPMAPMAPNGTGSWALLVSIIGAVVLVIRVWPALTWSRARWQTPQFADAFGPLVSIVIPARNEEATLPHLLTSLQSSQKIAGVRAEVILVNDQSTDRTEAVAREFGARLIASGVAFRLVNGVPLPSNEWSGKNWACHQAMAHVNGEYILFTDADTVHDATGLRYACQRMHDEKLDLLTALPFHTSPSIWERWLGPFQVFLLVGAGAFSKPRVNRIFAIGQYLLFRRSSYIAQGGHEHIRRALTDDLALAREVLRRGGRFVVEPRRLYQVTMYADFPAFLKGWRRNFRLGMRQTTIWSTVDTYLLIALLTCSMQFFRADRWSLLLALFAIAVVARVQRRFGPFGWWSALLYPWSLAVFITVTGLAVFDLLTRRHYSWRGRNY